MDWRLFHQENFLLRRKLAFKEFPSRYDHAHCAFCWEKFGKNDGNLHMGYCTEDEQHWICEQCFRDFKERFAWKVVP